MIFSRSNVSPAQCSECGRNATLTSSGITVKLPCLLAICPAGDIKVLDHTRRSYFVHICHVSTCLRSSDWNNDRGSPPRMGPELL